METERLQIEITGRVITAAREDNGWTRVAIHHPSLVGDVWVPPIEYDLKPGDVVTLFHEVLQGELPRTRFYWRINNGPRIDNPGMEDEQTISILRSRPYDVWYLA